MLKRISLSSALMIGCASTLYANGSVPGPLPVTEEPPVAAKTVETYVGLAGGMNFLRGSRHETSTFNNQRVNIPGSQKLHSNKGAIDLSFGAQYNLPNSKFFLAFEPYISFSGLYSKTGSSIPNASESRTIRSKYAAGADFKTGYKFTPVDSGYLSLGAEVRKVSFNFKATGGNDETARKNLMGISYGVGYERSFGNISVGIDFKHKIYKNSSLSITTDNGAVIKTKVKPQVFATMLTMKYKI